MESESGVKGGFPGAPTSLHDGRIGRDTGPNTDARRAGETHKGKYPRLTIAQNEGRKQSEQSAAAGLIYVER